MIENKEFIEYPKINKIYKHYKGGLYKVLFLSRHSETDEILVNYQSMLFGSYHSRPLDMWFEKVTKLEKTFKINDKVSRFEEYETN